MGQIHSTHLGVVSGVGTCRSSLLLLSEVKTGSGLQSTPVTLKPSANIMNRA